MLKGLRRLASSAANELGGRGVSVMVLVLAERDIFQLRRRRSDGKGR